MAGLTQLMTSRVFKMRMPAKRTGITLIELLTVIAIMGILMAMMVAAIAMAKRRTYESKAKAEVRELVRAWNAYWLAYGKFPAALTGVTNAEMTADNIKYLLATPSMDDPGVHRFLDTKIDVGTQGFRDPWGNYYRVDFSQQRVHGSNIYEATVCFPQRRRYMYDEN
jgi:type II secretory pathway pseudopilin PulG